MSRAGLSDDLLVRIPPGSGLPAGVVPVQVRVPDAELDELRSRLRRARLPETETSAGAGTADWSQGAPRAYVAELVRYWAEDYDWRRVEAELNRHGQFRTGIDGVDVHFLHRRSSRPGALPVLLTHGWPGSVVEFLDVLDDLVEPPDGQQAFDVVVPSLPGFGFSGRPESTGWGVDRIADAWAELMARLGYDRFHAHGGDWGSLVSTALAIRHPDRVASVHTTMPLAQPPAGHDPDALDPAEQQWLAQAQAFQREGSGYQMQQGTRPQTLGYGLTDSPAGQLAWIVEKFHGWTDCDGHPENAVSRDRILDTVSVYWLTATATSSARLYWEARHGGGFDLTSPVGVPTAVSYFPAEMGKLPRSWVESRYTDLRRWNVLARGGHFPALEVPADLVAELRASLSG